jgi:O-antigen/teichoic acid export membrane protein
LNVKIINFFKNFSYTLSSNLVTMIVSALIIFIVPKLIGVEEYGYWQLFLFYSSYVTFLQFGWTDGIYLRYGGAFPNDLDKQLFFSQFIMLLISQILIALVIIFYSTCFLADVDRKFIFQMTAAYMVFVNSRYLFTHILQATNRFKYFARIIILDRVIYVIIIILFLSAGVRNYRLFVITDIIGKTISLIYSIYICRDFALLKLTKFSFRFSETISNIKAGIKLMFANTASMLIIGSVRLGIERTWDVSTFGKVSLTLSISRFMIIFINAIGIIMFPMLRRTEQKKLPEIYSLMRNFFTVIIFGILFLYYPLKVILSSWLPAYASSLDYMVLLFPMSVYEGKMALLVNPYLKTLRKESLMLKINLLTFICSILISAIVTIVFKNLDLAVFSIIFMLAFRCIIAEILLSKFIKLKLFKDIVIESFIVSSFIALGWFLNSWVSAVTYLSVILIYYAIKRKEIKNSFKNIKKMLIAL